MVGRGKRMLNDGDDGVDVEGGRVLKRVVSWVGGGGGPVMMMVKKKKKKKKGREKGGERREGRLFYYLLWGPHFQNN